MRTRQHPGGTANLAPLGRQPVLRFPRDNSGDIMTYPGFGSANPYSGTSNFSTWFKEIPILSSKILLIPSSILPGAVIERRV